MQENITSNTQKIAMVKINRHTLLATTKRQNISQLIHTTKHQNYTNANFSIVAGQYSHVVVQQHSHKLLKMDILMPETC